jgi:hypothetical protein
MSIKRSNGNGTGPSESAAEQQNEPAAVRENAQVNEKINSYIKNNPKEWAYIQSMPRERLERSLVLQSVKRVERQQRIREGVLKKLEENPEMREAYRTLVKNLPAEQQEKAMANLALRSRRTVTPAQNKQAQGGVRV